jgi:hypothetical protein
VQAHRRLDAPATGVSPRTGTATQSVNARVNAAIAAINVKLKSK